MKQPTNQKQVRNILVFEAPKALAEKTKEIALAEMCSTSVICRRALNDYIISAERKTYAEQFATY